MTVPAPIAELLAAARRAQRAGDVAGMARLVETALAAHPTDFDAGLMRAEAAVHEGRYADARAALAGLEPAAWDDPRRLLRLAEFHSHMGRPIEAERCCARAVALSPNDTRALYDLAAASIALGRLDAAEALFDRVIADRSDDWDAWANRSTLRRATVERNHVAALETALAESGGDAEARIALGHALAKELEDLGRYDAAFAHLKDAAAARRARLSYRVADDAATMEAIAAAFPADLLRDAPPPSSEPGPIFVLGLPRSGTTLVDRILSSHSRVTSLGEIQDFALALIAQARGARDKGDLIRRSAAMDHAALGRAYRARTAGRTPDAPFAIDKTPLNFLYIGLIALALPEARIVHVRRGAMDGCFAMFKTLFRMGYPFSYDLHDLAAYRITYERLMAHWRAALPGRMIEIDYEALIADQAGESRRLIEGCGVEWEEACLAFHANPAPVATASAAQVRMPIHDRSVGLWRRYEQGLAPLAVALSAAGIALDHRA
ncbi:tetratricopeptide repeat protein [Sphingomonas sp. CL5.1]|jgi:tetratricopeptide (TPR) repeat protein|uniref:Sulfotransferase n=1 Tax=Sphingobium cyanobacteriorum TaxID=3063954 RepID=A0ABT8ZSS8_9SPHN|nr:MULTISPECIES: sulfotransferase [Sphingomonadaceae]MDO7837558.1 sulfotransferase [Sphingobium sp. HBC34]QKS00459.1 tetratricopeptide repeat protein [Sphingomonas sp. CL5.1]